MGSGQIGKTGENRAEVDRLLRSAREHRDEGRMDLARRDAISALALDPTNSDARAIRIGCDRAAAARRRTPPNLQVIRNADDFENEATTVQPMDISEEELLEKFLPSSERRAKAAEEVPTELQSDPDVQEALRWLDPPRNAPGEHARGEEMIAVTPAPVSVVPQSPQLPPHMVPQQHMIPQGYAHPSAYESAPYAMVNPQVQSGSFPHQMIHTGPYSPVDVYYTPNPSQAPMAIQPVTAIRTLWPWILLTAVVTGGGIALGALLFSRREPPAPAPVVTPVQRPAPVPTPTPVPVPTPTPTPAVTDPTAPVPVTADVTKLVRPDAIRVKAPVSGEVTKVFVRDGATVSRGDKLLQIRQKISGGSNPAAKKLAARVKELENMAQQDPVYQAFLDDARKELKAASGSRSATETVKVPVDGTARITLKARERVAGGKAVAEIISGDAWSAIASVPADTVDETWICAVTIGVNRRAPCTVERMEKSGDVVKVVASIGGKDAPWLNDLKQKPQLIFEPPPPAETETP